MSPERIAELQDAAMGKKGVDPITPVELQQLLGDVAVLQAKLAALEPKVAALSQANVDWAKSHAELRAYKERTEAALTEFSSELSNYGGVPTNYYREELRRLGLWREGGA